MAKKVFGGLLKIVALAYNYQGYDHPPIVFMKAGATKDNKAIWIPDGKVWAEAELGFVIGDSLGVGAYVLANDVTLEIEGQDCHLAQSKCRDSFCPIKEIETPPAPRDVILRTTINGRLVQEGNTRDRVLDEEAALCHISHFMTLEPGDIVLTGTPPHRGKTRLQHGDIVDVEAVGLGSLRNVVRRRNRL